VLVLANYRTIGLANVGSVATTGVLSKYNDFDLFLAPLALRNESYASFCATRSQLVFTIMDSGALETVAGTDGTDIKPSDLLDLSIELGVHEVVCSDCPGDPHGSLLRTQEFIRLYRQRARGVRLRLMVVPHGRSLDEWFWNANELIRDAGRCTVGIPRLLAKACGSADPSFRLGIAETIRRSYPGILSHLLGAGENFLLELSQMNPGVPIRSIDSTFVYRYACTAADPAVIYVPPLPLSSDVIPPFFCDRLDAIVSRLWLHLGRCTSNG